MVRLVVDRMARGIYQGVMPRKRQLGQADQKPERKTIQVLGDSFQPMD
jgi:hypothetical protein